MPSDASSDNGQSERAIAAALSSDPPPNPEWPAETLPQAIPSGDVNLNAVFYSAAGVGPHPTAPLLHGLPGNEQNIDCAQSIRRAGWNVLTIHYRGSWGGPRNFTFAHCLEDATAALSWLQTNSFRKELSVDPRRIVVMGHSMGGFVVAHTAASHPDVSGTVLISGVDLGQAFGRGDEGDAAIVADNIGASAGLHILAGTSPRSLVSEARAHAEDWCLASYASLLAGRPLLMTTSDDGFAAASDALADAVGASTGAILTRAHLATDHNYSSCRIELQFILLEWLLETAELRPSDRQSFTAPGQQKAALGVRAPVSTKCG